MPGLCKEPSPEQPDFGGGSSWRASFGQLGRSAAEDGCPEGRAVYGTRCATLVVAVQQPEGLQIRVRERRFDAWGGVAGA